MWRALQGTTIGTIAMLATGLTVRAWETAGPWFGWSLTAAAANALFVAWVVNALERRF